MLGMLYCFFILSLHFFEMEERRLRASRHYVAFIRKHISDEGSESWVLYNDEKVVKAVDVEGMKKFAYVYFFNRV